MLYLFICLSNF